MLKHTLEEVRIENCARVVVNFMDLADFPRLKTLDLDFTAVTGDIRDFGEQDFSALEKLTLPPGVYGGYGYEFQGISDAPDVINSLYSIKKQRPTLLMKYWYAKLSKDSSDWYDVEENDDTAPLFIIFVQAGSRFGYRWESAHEVPQCEVNWLDPEPDRESSDYEKYIEELHEIGTTDRKKYLPQISPATNREEEYYGLWEEYED